MDNTKIFYYEEERDSVIEHLVRIGTDILPIVAILFLCITWLIIQVDIWKLGVGANNDTEVNTEIYAERIPVKEMMDYYIASLPIPEETLEISSQQSYTEEDVELLARLMYAEVGVYIYKFPEDEAEYIHKLTGSVVIHRKNMNYRNAETIQDVIHDDGQYACVDNGSINQEVPEIVYEWAEELLRDGPIGPENMIFQAQFEQGSARYDHVGNQYFCLE